MDFKVSVIIPVYNAQLYLEKAVLSATVLNETGEVIIIDDGSIDHSIEIGKRLEKNQPKVKFLQHTDKKNHGVSASRNLGIASAACPYVAFLDADDYYLLNRFRKDSLILKNQLEIDGVYNALGITYYTQKGKDMFLNAGYKYQEFLTIERVVDPKELPLVLLKAHKVKGEFSVDCITVRRSVFEKTGNFNTNLMLNEDTHLWLRMSLKCKIVAGNITEAVAIRGVHDNNTMVHKEKQPNANELWFKSLNTWINKNDIKNTYKAVFKRKYLSFIFKQEPLAKAFFPFLGYFFMNPKYIAEYYGFFDLSFFDLFGRNKVTFTLISVKNKFLQINES
tara:strand:+ start:1489 stop:2493 length:1005 start_codon:yes stop_codon:yes gene_type:complete